ncbi:MAG: hypothetical protein V4793_14970 [Paraburkholderia tropica]|uniref:Uncharacterized protein n=1 Tax=Paraburkholderia tropica TaxID=92647 RepID=A0AAQ1JXQ8_9BURK|nr:hypothetical protein [Paraburkholderia tropica]MBB3005005.1 hypothetical protein [Paraburkholderia tropica]MBB6323293.1 hypothetical protein [Paraburkholderia tropica]RQN37197.1 hypothetical protein EHZ25_19790 [Paraburkholderia tropica]SEK13229.1 hypothetical protein SAMN05216550_123133 [Paraburkholderia tropica]
MPFQSPLQPIIYRGEHGRPSAMYYRIAFTEHEPWLAVIELSQAAADFPSPVVSVAPRDHVLNRVLEHDLRGVPLNLIKLVATDPTGSFGFEFTPDFHDYVRRDNRYEIHPEKARRGRVVERIEIDPENLTAGSVRVDTVHATAADVAPEVAAALA